ncbi:hypothetical protein MYX75_01090 [Acidobacteria bacterium AH-259-A15]|nr:hypothetical protein [Acidobacteria bacterium AH-259-A15]
MGVFSDIPPPDPALLPIQSESSGWKTVTSSASADTDGSYVELIASTGFKATRIIISIISAGSETSLGLFDIATGAGGSEVDKIVDMGHLRKGGAVPTPEEPNAVYAIDFDIPSGSRLAARIKDNKASAVNYDIAVTILG